MGSAAAQPDEASLTAGIERLGEVRRLIERTLYRDYVPNVFEYDGERDIYECGSHKRGAWEQKEILQRAFDRVQARLRDFEERRDELERKARKARERAEQSRLDELNARQQYDERRSAWLLGLIGVVLGTSFVFDAYTFFEDVQHQADLLNLQAPAPYVAAAILVVLLVVAWVSYPRRSLPVSEDAEQDAERK